MIQAHEFQRTEMPTAPNLAESPRPQPAESRFDVSLQDLVDQARLLIGAHHAIIRIAVDEQWSNVHTVMSCSDEYAVWNTAAPAAAGSTAAALWCPVFRPMRMTRE